MRPLVPTYKVDGNERVSARVHDSGRCTLTVGSSTLIFETHDEAVAVLEGWALAARLAVPVGAPR